MWRKLIPAAARLATGPGYRRLQSTLDDPVRAQGRLLKRLTARLASSAYGRSLGVRAGDGYSAFRAKIPPAGYSELAPWLERWRAGEPGMLTSERALFWQQTSGSGGPAKHIPYTPGLLGSFRRMFSAWLGDVLRHGPSFETGQLFVSLSPANRELGKDAPQSEPEYLGGGLRALLDPLVTPPSSLLDLREPADFRRALRLALLSRADRLEALSVWNPTAFTAVLGDIVEHRAATLEDCRRGRFGLGPAAPSTIDALRADDPKWSSVFPRVRFISCWDSGWAAPSARRLGSLFPDALLQGKGLLATEAPVTIPLLGAPGCVPLLSETFLEFEEAGGRVIPLAEVERGGEYTLLITTLGGLYRYRLGDRIRVGERFRGVPTLALAGRADGVVDLVGEKLAEPFVEGALSELGLDASAFRTLVPVHGGGGPSFYALWHDGVAEPALARRLDAALSRSHRYREARALGQLAEPKVMARPDAGRRYLDYLAARGMRVGDVKSRALVRQPMDERDVDRFMGRAHVG